MARLPFTTALTTLFSYGLLFAFGQLRDFFRMLIDWFKATSVKVRQLYFRSDLAFLMIYFGFDAGLPANLPGPRGFLHTSPLPADSGTDIR